ncbi:MAG TPA: YcnI family protein [Actinomycetota bacterium]|jgi:periplasmic copper chaperone A|nr:YcnI family protein [Actinomycetota bacterium]
MRKVVLIGGAALVALVTAVPAWAHVTVQPNEAPAGSFFRFVVRVPNERDNASTTKVEVQFPDNLVFVSFQDKQGWERSVQMRQLDEPIEVFGEEMDEVVGSVTWSGGEIGPHEFEEFGFSARVPEGEDVLEFPALQTYDSGEVVRWIGPADSEEPAARVSVVDLGLEEGQGQLGVLADLRDQVSRLEAQGPGDEEEGGADIGMWLGALGALLGGAALVVALTRRRT